MWDRIERLSAPAAEVLSLAEAKQACRIDGSDDDAFINRAIKAARDLMEGPDGAGIALVAAQWQMRMDCLAGEIWIPMGPVLAIDSIAWLDDAGVLQIIPPADYQWRKGGFEARIKPAYGVTWPTVRHRYDAAQITFTAGFPGTADDPPSLAMIPEVLRTAMLMMISHWNEHRETVVLGQIPSEVQHGFRDLVNRYRVGRFS